MGLLLNYQPESSDLPFDPAEIEKVEVVAGTWKVYLRRIKFSPEEEQIFRQVLLARVPGLRQVEFYLVPPNLTLEKIIQEAGRPVIPLLEERLPGVAVWLRTACWQTADGQLRIEVANELGVQFLNRCRCAELLEELLRERWNLSVQVEIFTREEAGNECVSELDLLEREALREILTAGSFAETSQQQPKKPDKPLLGKLIKGLPTPLNRITEEERSAVIRGRLMKVEEKEFKTGRRMIIMNLTDYTDSLAVKFFLEEGQETPSLTAGQWLVVRGPVRIDKFSQELTLIANDLNLADPPWRADDASEKRVELHAHTKMSSMDGLSGAAELVGRAARWGHSAVAITDHGVVQAFPEAYEAGKKHGIKIIYGVEGYLVDEPGSGTAGEKTRSYHVVILVKNRQGLRHLYELITLSHIKYFHRQPRIPRAELASRREGLLIGSACEAGELIQAYLRSESPDRLTEIAGFYDYLEVQPIGNNAFLLRNGTYSNEEDLREIVRTVVDLGRQIGRPVVASGDIHFVDPCDEVYRRILMAGKGFEDAEDQAPLYFKTTAEMLAEFAYLGEETANSVVVANPCLIAGQIEEVLPIPLETYPPKIDGAEEQIREMAWSEACRRYGRQLPEIVQLRLEKELNGIINNGFAVLYLIAHKLVKKSNDDGYLVGSRGSVGSSLVATMTAITEVNPLPAHYLCPNCCYSEFITDGSIGCGPDLPDKICPQCGTLFGKQGHDIPFEVFMGFKGDKVPDIDLNFSGEYQSRAHRYTEELFGSDHVFRAGTIATIADRTAYGFVKNYLDERKIVTRNAEVDRLVMGCTGVKRTTGQHPGGLMVVPRDRDIHEFSPIQRPADDLKSETFTTHFDYHSISERLVKLDILGHDDPTALKMLADLTGVDLKSIPLDDPETMSIFSSCSALGVTPEIIGSEVGTLGIPEFGTRFVRQMLEDTRPHSFAELVRISGFSHGTDVWLNNAQDLIKNGAAKLTEAISTRDDIMVYLIYKGMEPAQAFKIMEGVRKGKGVKPEDEDAMRRQLVPDWYIGSCKKIKYMFPKAHAVAYVTMAFRIAYFKVHYPEAFYATFFTVRADDFDAAVIASGLSAITARITEIERKGNKAPTKEKNLLTILEIAREAFARGIKILPVNLSLSEVVKFLITPHGILPPLVALQGLGEAAAWSIVQARAQGEFNSVDDLRLRSRVSKTVIEVLETHGCLEGLSNSAQMSLF